MMKTINLLSLALAGSAFILASSAPGQAAPVCSWDAATKELSFSLSRLSGVLNCDLSAAHGKSHHFSKVVHKPSNTLVSPDAGGMVKAGLLNYFRVLTTGGYLTELRVEPATLRPEKDGITLIYEPTIRRQARVTAQFTFREPNIIDLDLRVETLASYPGFEILLSAYMAPGFESGAYVAKQEFGPTEPQQIRIQDQPMIHGVWPFFPRDEAGAHRLTDGRHQKGRYFWRMAIGRRYGLPLAFFSKGEVDVLLMGRPEDVYAVGATYTGDAETDSIARHRSLYLSLFGEDFQPGEGRRTQMRMIIDDFGSDPMKHAELYQTFLKEVGPIPRTFPINPAE
ncbi:MAG: hypothetical protein PSV13_08990 [Lacunisphaera sp.]|nr:hypothetical protein [Lacunisphaera sp.]